MTKHKKFFKRVLYCLSAALLLNIGPLFISPNVKALSPSSGGGSSSSSSNNGAANSYCAKYSTSTTSTVGAAKNQGGVELSNTSNLNSCLAGYNEGFNKSTNTNSISTSSISSFCSKQSSSSACQDGYTQAFTQNGGTISSSNNTSSGINTPTCQSQGDALAWFTCQIIDGLGSATDWIYANLIQPLLITQPINLNPSSTPGSSNYDPSHTMAIWSNFRDYGDIILIIALLVIVFGESIGGGLIDAYTAKKVLPRLLLAIILVNLSIYIVAAAIDVTNVLGDGMNNLIEAPFQGQMSQGCASKSGCDYYTLQIHTPSTKTELEIAGGALLLGGTAGILAHLFKNSSSSGTSGLSSAENSNTKSTLKQRTGSLVGKALEYFLVIVVIPIFCIMLAILATVIIRRALILILIFVAPIAFALYCLPNTEKYFRKWWDTLLKTLLIYPLIAIFFALGDVLSVTISSSSTGITGIYASLLGVVAMFVPLFMIPFSFRFAGGILGQVHDLTHRGATMAHRGILGDEKDPDSLRNRAKRGFAISRAESGLSSREMWQRVAKPHEMLSKEGRRERSRRLSVARGVEMSKLGAQVAESDATMKNYLQDDMTMFAVADREKSQAKLDKDTADYENLLGIYNGLTEDEKKSNDGRKMSDDISMKKQQILARQQAHTAADLILSSGSSSVREQAALQLASMGYQFGAGPDGVNEVESMIESIAGGDENARIRLSNAFNYRARTQGGRADQGDIRYGARISEREAVKSGIRKTDSFNRGRGKVDTYKGGGQAYLGNYISGENEKGETQFQIYDDASDADISEWHSILTRDLQSSPTEANRQEIMRQLEGIKNSSRVTGNEELQKKLAENEAKARTILNPDDIHPKE